MDSTTLEEKLALVPTLLSNSHERPTKKQIADAEVQACVMEAVAFIAGEPWSDRPKCACPVITSFMIRWNDRLSTDAKRNELLRPLIPFLINTRATREIELQRGYMAADWSIRWRSPKLARAFGANEVADALEKLSPIVDEKSAAAARAACYDLRNRAWEDRRSALTRLRERFTKLGLAAAADAAAAAAAVDAAAAAAADAAADAAAVDAAAAAVDAADAAADAADAADAAADAADAAAAALSQPPEWFKKVSEAYERGGYWEAYKVARAAFEARERERIAPLSLEINASAQDLVRRMCALGKAAE